MTTYKQNIMLGVLLMLGCQFFSASVVTAVKLASAQIPVLIIVFINYCTCLLLITLFILLKRGPSLRTEHATMQITRSCLGLLYFAGLFTAVKYIPVVDGILLRGTAPIWLPLITFAFMGDKIKPKLYWGISMGFIGIICVLHPSLVKINIGYLLALLAGIFYAISGMLTGNLNKLGEPLLRTLFYAFAIPCIILLPYALGHWPATIDLKNIYLLIFSGLGSLTLLALYVASLRYAPAIIILPISYVGVIFGGVYDWALWQYAPNLISICGMILVIGGCYLTIKLSQPEK